MPETREQIIERAIAFAEAEAGVSGPISDDAIEAALPVIVRAVTDRLREMHRGHECHDGLSGEDLCFVVHGGYCAKVGTCQQCEVQQPCPTVRLLDQIDAELGGE